MSSTNIEFIASAGQVVRTDESFILDHDDHASDNNNNNNHINQQSSENPSSSSSSSSSSSDVIYLRKPTSTFTDFPIRLFELQDDGAFGVDLAASQETHDDDDHQRYEQSTQTHHQHHTPQQSLVLIVDEDVGGMSPVETKDSTESSDEQDNEDEDGDSRSMNEDNEATCSSTTTRSDSSSSSTSTSSTRLLKIKSATPSVNIVPALSNVEDIFNILSRKIAKYCQILSDLTSCEVFYKAQLPVTPPSHLAPKTQPSKYKPKNVVNKNIRSLYWGTNKMLFEHSHAHGLRYQKSNGDSLIKIGSRSLNGDMSSLIEELLKEPVNHQTSGFDNNNTNSSQSGSYKVQTRKLMSKHPQQKQQQQQQSSHSSNSLPAALCSGKSLIKECSVGVDRLDDETFEYYLKKFEAYNNNPNPYQTMMDFDLLVEECAQEEELYSSEAKFKIEKKTKRRQNVDDEMIVGLKRRDHEEFVYHEGGEQVGDDDLNDRVCYSLENRLESIENEDELYSCEYCEDHYYKHLTQLRLHHLTCHEQVRVSESGPYVCERCGLGCGGGEELSDRVEYLKHLLVCYYPDIYTCKSCDTAYSTYPQYYFHLKYVHIPVVYMCAVCSRKYRNINELIEHDQLMHSKTVNSCELCGQALKSRAELHEHYVKSHVKIDEARSSKSTTSEEVEKRPSITTSGINEMVEKETVETTTLAITTTSLVDEMITKSTDTASNPTASVITRRGVSTDEIIMDDDDDDVDVEIEDDDDDEERETVNQKAVLLQRRAAESAAAAAVSAATILSRDSDDSEEEDENDEKYRENEEQDDEDDDEWPKVHKNDLIRGLIDRKHQCKWCSLRFYSKSQLKQHEATHTDSVLVCPVCDKQFTQKDRLSGHMKCHMEPSLACKVCGKKFKRLCNLYNHELVHGLTEHAFMLCQFCGRGFRSRRDYQNHVIANHRELLMKSESNNEEDNDSSQSKPNKQKKNQKSRSSTVTGGGQSKSSKAKRAKTKHSEDSVNNNIITTVQSTSQTSICYRTTTTTTDQTTTSMTSSSLDDYIF